MWMMWYVCRWIEVMYTSRHTARYNGIALPTYHPAKTYNYLLI